MSERVYWECSVAVETNRVTIGAIKTVTAGRGDKLSTLSKSHLRLLPFPKILKSSVLSSAFEANSVMPVELALCDNMVECAVDPGKNS